MHSRFATQRRRAAWMSANIGLGYRTWGPGSPHGSPDYSPITLQPATRGIRRKFPDAETVCDMEHYIRLAQEIINASCERHRPRPRDYTGGDAVDIESELRDRLLASADRLGHDLAELLAWLETRTDRRAGLLTDRRGRERRRAGDGR